MNPKTKNPLSKKIFGLTSFTFVGLFTVTTVTPAYAIEYVDNGEVLVQASIISSEGTPEFFQVDDRQIQTLSTGNYADPTVVSIPAEVELSEEYLAELKRQEEEAARQAAAEAARASQSSGWGAPLPVVNVPVSERAGALVAAARAQLGYGQDCTDLVQNSLAAIGMFQRRDQGGYDLGPMGFGQFGVQIHPSEARPGDIMMRPGHVAIYTGDGYNHSAVHGGWSGNTVESTYDSDPYSYTVIRI